MAVLVVGGDSRLSRELIPLLVAKKEKVYATTRRTERSPVAGEQSLLLDLAEVDSFVIPDDVSSMLIIGGVVDYGLCTNQYDYAYKVNCINIPKLAGQLWARGGYVCFISTNTVFKFEQGLPNEDDLRCPGFAYAKLKAEAEEKLEQLSAGINCAGNFSIMRLTKNVGPETSPFGNWMQELANNHVIRPFNDLFFAPVRFADSANAIMVLLEKKMAGIFHFSGERDIDYASFAAGLCRHLGLSGGLVRGVRSSDVGVHLTYNHPITALGMKLTRQRLQLEPVPLSVVYASLGMLLKR